MVISFSLTFYKCTILYSFLQDNFQGPHRKILGSYHWHRSQVGIRVSTIVSQKTGTEEKFCMKAYKSLWMNLRHFRLLQSHQRGEYFSMFTIFKSFDLLLGSYKKLLLQLYVRSNIIYKSSFPLHTFIRSTCET